jgi:hypothetical protein
MGQPLSTPGAGPVEKSGPRAGLVEKPAVEPVSLEKPAVEEPPPVVSPIDTNSSNRPSKKGYTTFYVLLAIVVVLIAVAIFIKFKKGY